MKYEVEIAASGEDDLRGLCRSIEERYGMDTAVAWQQSLSDVAVTLESFPNRCSLAPENEHSDREVRQLLHKRHRVQTRIIFTVDGNTVQVVHIRNSRQKPRKDEMRL